MTNTPPSDHRFSKQQPYPYHPNNHKIMKKILNIALVAIIALIATGCENPPFMGNQNFQDKKNGGNNLEVVQTSFSQDFKTFSVNVKVPANISITSLTDSSRIHIETQENDISHAPLDDDMQPQLVHVQNIHQQELADNDLSLLILADLTLPEEEILAEKQAIQQMRTWFAPSNLFIAFMRDNGVTESLPLTDYIMNNYFQPSKSKKYLYRSILEKLTELSNWQLLTDDEKGLIIFSDGDVYNGNQPIDPQHYALQEKLLHITSDQGYSSVKYINCGDAKNDSTDVGDSNEAKSIMEQLTKNTGGIYLDCFNWSKLLTDILEKYDIEYADYQLDFVNPNNKVFVGEKLNLKINVFDDRKLLTSGMTEYAIGSIYSPVIVHGVTLRQLILQGILLTILFFAFAYLLLQFIIPYISYKIFKRRYVTHYINPNMLFNGIQVSQSCYYCKAPFEEGDEIVVKCKHVVHKECWDENEYKCPEAGRHCKEGSHYYNNNNLLDRRNAPFYATWVMGGIMAGLVCWILYIIFMMRPSSQLLYDLMLSIHGLKAGTMQAQEAYDLYIKHITRMPIFGMALNLSLTFFLSYMSQHGLPRSIKLKWSIAKALLSGLIGYIIFLAACLVSIILNLQINTVIVDCLPWIADGFIIAYLSIINTRIKLKKIFIAISCAVGIISMYAWSNLLFHSMMDNRIVMLLCCLLYSVVLAVSLAASAPRSERYFLHVEGAIKPIDIALYKWMRSSPSYIVTIGKSVSCSLQMSWDFASNIAAVQATITREHGKLYLTAEEEGVIVDNHPLEPEKRIHLYHGRKFIIGKTLFTYIEKDV